MNRTRREKKTRRKTGATWFIFQLKYRVWLSFSTCENVEPSNNSIYIIFSLFLTVQSNQSNNEKDEQFSNDSSIVIEQWRLLTFFFVSFFLSICRFHFTFTYQFLIVCWTKRWTVCIRTILQRKINSRVVWHEEFLLTSSSSSLWTIRWSS